ncbi:hypothetical protein [uncultured Bradyrhizobium sp.]|uniref:hypothetical protein n=1 Tax=uncultured Bradyrhizobium sp. TaxID=199684 RepID=UPI00260387D1|nr:hypothetical protein [uncultured Bradyrhizobium sp.]
MEFITKVLFFAAIPAFVVAAYHQFKFGEEWIEDHAQSLDWLSRNRQSAGALFSASLFRAMSRAPS